MGGGYIAVLVGTGFQHGKMSGKSVQISSVNVGKGLAPSDGKCCEFLLFLGEFVGCYVSALDF